MNEQTREKISYKLRGRRKSATTRKLISQALRGRAKTGQHRAAISEAMVAYWKIKKTNLLKTYSNEYLNRQIEDMLHTE